MSNTSNVTFRPLNDTERAELINSLKGNADGRLALKMNPKDTSFAGAAPVDEISDLEVITAIKSVPVHY
jgi:hypothetical protein